MEVKQSKLNYVITEQSGSHANKYMNDEKDISKLKMGTDSNFEENDIESVDISKIDKENYEHVVVELQVEKKTDIIRNKKKKYEQQEQKHDPESENDYKTKKITNTDYKRKRTVKDIIQSNTKKETINSFTNNSMNQENEDENSISDNERENYNTYVSKIQEY